MWQCHNSVCSVCSAPETQNHCGYHHLKISNQKWFKRKIKAMKYILNNNSTRDIQKVISDRL